ncbi:hypothetical protein [Amycolatopsis saalfeldensis]|uniref:Zinc-finger n=1 Tax=Amycolatopsis saalfeldensis TaxID=394193 RepID=A0A1H8YNX8_9PSEU|nr:hypothetical protein [Amycolatopsis saalfeldensis]SEP53783.1 hypothetical protein SAMN04489732_13122 [Amycolatopsis saalfeldensis]
MTALIYIDLTVMRPVVDDVWHLTQPSAVPAPGEEITMLCGETAVAAFVPLSERTAHRVTTQCPYCDLEYCSSHGYEISPHHPGLVPRARPTSRSPR